MTARRRTGAGPKHAIAALGLAVALLMLAAQLRLHPYAFDDAYIHFRIAENFAAHGEPYFNPGEAVKASSSSGWTLLLAGLVKLGAGLGASVDLPRWVAVLNWAMTLGSALVYAALLDPLTPASPPPALRAAVGVLYVALVRPPAVGLMETPTALLVAGLGLHLLWRGRSAGFALLGAAPFFRPELGGVLGLAWLYAWLERHSAERHSAERHAAGHPFDPRRVIVASCLGALPFVAYDLRYFGTLVPHAIRAKSLLYDLTLEHVARTLARSLIPEIALPGLHYRPSDVVRFGSSLGLVALAGGLLVYRAIRQEPPAPARRRALLLMWSALLAGAYLATHAFIFPWYVPLVSVPLMLAVAAALAAPGAVAGRIALAVLAAPLLITQLCGLGQLGWAALADPAYYQDFEPGARVRHYLQVGAELYARYPDATLMTSEIGALGYTFRGYIQDGAGLVSPDALAYHPMRVPEERSHGAVGALPVPFVMAHRPELIVSYDTFIEALLKNPAAQTGYRRETRPLFLEDDLQRTEQRTLWGSHHLNIFYRHDVAQRRGVAQSNPSN
jgi:hypothetical protein